jgi:hypothetical protein
VKAPNPPRQQRRSAVVAATAAVIAAAALAMLTACGGGSGSDSPGVADVGASARSGSPSPSRSASDDAVAYSRCMRSHGVPTFPDPGSDAAVPKADARRLGVSSTQLQAAQQACQSRLPATDGSFDEQERQCYGGGSCPPALVQQMLTVGRKYAACMRSHGVPDWPDPALDSQARPYFDISGAGITYDQWHSTAMRAKADECGSEAGGGLATG